VASSCVCITGIFGTKVVTNGYFHCKEVLFITRNLLCLKAICCVVGVCRQLTFTVLGLLTGLAWYKLNVGTLEAMLAVTNLLFSNLIALVRHMTCTCFGKSRDMHVLW
jgi:hypothetical protein